MPTLEITRRGLAPDHASATFDYVLSIMLWPIECEMRREFQRTWVSPAAGQTPLPPCRGCRG